MQKIDTVSLLPSIHRITQHKLLFDTFIARCQLCGLVEMFTQEQVNRMENDKNEEGRSGTNIAFQMSKQYTTGFIVLVTECIVFISTGSCLLLVYKFLKTHLWCHNIKSIAECEGDIGIDSFRSNYGAFDFDKFATTEWVKSLYHYDNKFIYSYKARRDGHS